MSGHEFRKDIQGLRAVAVLLVLAYHLWPESVTGGFVGVDVFFVISGFLITAHLLQHPPRRPRDLAEFWGRRIRRLLPAALLVLIVTAIASRIVAPDTRWAAIAGETIASALYVQNWVLAGSSVDYLSSEEPPTPVQHYWSLSVEEQFYLVWPILILALFWFARRSGVGSVLVTRLAMLAVVTISLLVSIAATSSEPAMAYFITPTRIWELAVGGLVATLPSLASSRLPSRAGDGAAWIGLAMIVVAGVTFTEATPFPGDAALLPVGGTALVILAAAQSRAAPTRLLGYRPMQHVGDTSYSIYLWHWPLIVLWPYAFGVEALTPIDSIAIVVATLGLASLSKTHVEDAFRFSPRFQPLLPTFRFAVVGMLVVSVLGSAQLVEARIEVDAAAASIVDEEGGSSEDSGAQPPDVVLERGSTLESGTPIESASIQPAATTAPSGPIEPAASAADTASGTVEPGATAATASCTGAASLVRGFTECPQDPAATMRPRPVAAARDASDAYRDGCWIYAPFSTRTTCKYGHGDVKIALVGNSHAGQWLPTLQVLAKKHGWTITTFLASRCNATDAALQLYSSTAGCLDYGRWAMDKTRGDAFDLVITSERQSVRTKGDTWKETLPAAVEGYRSYLRRWSEAGTNLLVLQDTPFPGRTLASVPDCLAKHRTDQPACSGTPGSWRWMDPLFQAATDAALPGVSVVETYPFLCTAEVCPAVIGSVIVYFDKSHLTATYARSIAPFIEAQIVEALGAS